jgi:hypothetical protein
MSSSPGNSCLQKCRKKLRTKDPKWLDFFPDIVHITGTCKLIEDKGKPIEEGIFHRQNLIFHRPLADASY